MDEAGAATRASVAVIVLAAGASRRMGRPKQLLPFEGTTLLRHVVQRALQSASRPVVVVLGCQAAEIAPQLEGFSVQIAVNQDWQEGMSSSIRAGLKRLQKGCGTLPAVIFITCDQPAVDAELINRLSDLHCSSSSPIVACRYQGALGVPALFAAPLFPQLMALRGDQGARSILRSHIRQVEAVEFPEGEYDIDRPEDLNAWRGSRVQSIENE